MVGLGVFLAALAPRLSTWAGTFRGPLVLLEEVDAWYHLRRIELALANSLVPPAIDTYNNHPAGAVADWAPGFDVLFAVAWHLLSKVLSVTPSPAAIGAVGVAVLGSFAAAVLAMACARWGIWAGLAAGLAVAWSPAAVAYSRVGRLDHHAIEPLALALMCVTYAWMGRRASAGRAATLGAVMASLTVFWPGLALYGAALAIAVLLETMSASLARDTDGGAEGYGDLRTGEAEALRRGTIAYLVAAAVSTGLALTSHWGREMQVVYFALSWFQPLLFAAIALAFGGIHSLRARGVHRSRAWGAAAVGFIITALMVGEDGSVGRGMEFLLRTDVVAASLLESRSLAEVGPAYALRLFTPVGLALPALWAVTAAQTWRRRAPMDPLIAAALALGVLATPFAFLQIRFAPHAAVATGLLLAALVARVGVRLMAGGAVAAAAAVLAWGVRPGTLPDSAVHPYLLGGFDALVWLRQQAPATSHLRNPVELAEYSVAAEWVWGHWITQIGQKPNVANPLSQTPDNLEGIDDVARLFLAESEEEALVIAERRGVRYVLLSAIPVTISQLAVQTGRDPDRYVSRVGNGRPRFHPAFFRTFHSRLYLAGGDNEGTAATEPVSRARLVFESRARIEFLGSRPTVRIFEIVPGALLQGNCRSEEVEVRAKLEGKTEEYLYRTRTEPNGDFRVRVPYASEATDASIPAGITVRCGERGTEVEIAERDVWDGRSVFMTPAAGGRNPTP